MASELSFSFMGDQDRQSLSDSLIAPCGEANKGVTVMKITQLVPCCSEDASSFASDSFSSHSAWKGPQQPDSRMSSSCQDDAALIRRPIVVGYAFSEKKMSTMGVVMAEASRTKLRYFEQDDEDDDDDDDDDDDYDDDDGQEEDNSNEAEQERGDSILPPLPAGSGAARDPYTAATQSPLGAPRRWRDPHQRHQDSPTDNVVFSLQLGGYHSTPNVPTSGTAASGGTHTDITTTVATTTTTPLDHVVRFFRSSCSSIHDNSCTDTLSNKSLRSSSCSSTAYTSNASMLTAASTTAAAATCTTTYGGGPNHHYRNSHRLAILPSSGASSAVTRVSSSSSLSSPLRHQQQLGKYPRHTLSHTVRLPSTGTLPPPIHIAFVPIDPDQPVEEQHGGRMDVILHKLTEDILSLSQLPPPSASQEQLPSEMPLPLPPPSPWRKSPAGDLDPVQRAAVRRIGNLRRFASDTGCCLLDDPVLVQALMRRDTISSRLEASLRGVKSRSGVPVSTPRWTVLTATSACPSRDTDDMLFLLDRQVRGAELRYPLIIKPLIAAGASASHAMAVAMTPLGLANHLLASSRRDERERCAVGGSEGGKKCSFLCQEYTNHDEALYKVYVLGSHVSVHKRRSLPNLPTTKKGATTTSYSSCVQDPLDQGSMIASGVRLKNLVEFDSQRPYPRLTDFLDPLPECETDQPTESFSQSSCQPALASAQQGAVTAEEVGPVVDALRAAFGLDLFGFDVLVAPTPPSQQSYPYEWLVVDVNYFPSYKEVNDFPSLLAKYLTQRALQDRAHKLHSLALQRPVQDAQQYDHPAERLNELRPSHTVDEPVSH